MKQIMVSLSLMTCFCAMAPSAQPPKIKEVPVKPSVSIEGKDLFTQYCAVCHGADLKGGGPAAPALRKAPGDLTMLAVKNGGKYPEVRVSLAINGEVGVVAHGTREMPVWGTLFRPLSANEDIAKIRVYNLMKYIESLQQK